MPPRSPPSAASCGSPPSRPPTCPNWRRSAGEAAAAGPLIGQWLAVAAAAASGKGGEFLDPLASGERVATLVHGGSAFVPCARAADLFLIVDRDAGVRLVPAREGVPMGAVRASDTSRPVSTDEIADGAGERHFEADGPMHPRRAAGGFDL